MVAFYDRGRSRIPNNLAFPVLVVGDFPQPVAKDYCKGQGIKLLLSFTGRNDLWGYQVTIVGKDFHAGYSRCYQINNQVATTDHHFLFPSRDIRLVHTSDVIVVFVVTIVRLILLAASVNQYELWLLKSRFHYRLQFCL